MTLDPVLTGPLMAGQVINTISGLKNFLRDSSGQTSLTSLTSVARVEPLTVVESSLLHYASLPEIMQSLQSLFTGYYLQGLSIVTGEIGGISVDRILDRLNPNRTINLGMESLKEGTYYNKPKVDWRSCTESYKYRLPMIANEAAGREERQKFNDLLDNDTLLSVKELADLSVGKLINVEIRDGEKSMKLPISIRLMVNQIPNASLFSLLTSDTRDNTLVERYHAWRAGRINFVSDLILCQDMIDEHKKVLAKDNDGVYTQIMARANAHKAVSLATKNPSLAAASNLVVISDTMAREVEKKLGGNINSTKVMGSYNVREAIFRSGYMMILVIVSPEWDRVTFYHRGINAGTEVSIADIKAANKSKGPDISEILKAYQMGSAPGL